MNQTATLASPIRSKFSLFFLVFSLAVGCVTVNVNFPEGAVQKASDDYVRDLYRTKEQSKASPKATAPPVDDSAFLSPREILNHIVPSALADDSFNMSSARLEDLKQKMKVNVPDVIAQKRAGVLGETSEGKLSIHDSSKLKPLLKKKIQDIVKEDNQLRDSLYSEVVRSNHLPSNSLSAVKKSFARSFQAESPSGTWVQSETGTWAQKP
jgi:uncharacterized protein YdbL (DUF1318 family)